ncbi:hypothetical protein [Embleya sp. NPDC005971]|uniref:hypothetical protein n=1 Tax=Embleya sp. NPDC005971 TaxID=3156724 RepID=UPI0033DD8467
MSANNRPRNGGSSDDQNGFAATFARRPGTGARGPVPGARVWGTIGGAAALTTGVIVLVPLLAAPSAASHPRRDLAHVAANAALPGTPAGWGTPGSAEPAPVEGVPVGPDGTPVPQGPPGGAPVGYPPAGGSGTGTGGSVQYNNGSGGGAAGGGGGAVGGGAGGGAIGGGTPGGTGTPGGGSVPGNPTTGGASGGTTGSTPGRPPVAPPTSPAKPPVAPAQGPQQVYNGYAGLGCSNSGAGFRVQGQYSDGKEGWYKVGSGGLGTAGCGDDFWAIPMSGSKTKDDSTVAAVWTWNAGAKAKSCSVQVYVPGGSTWRDAAGKPAFYQVLDTDSSSAPVRSTFTVDQTSHRGAWIQGVSLPVKDGKVVLRMVNRGEDWVGPDKTYAHLAAGQARVLCYDR